MRSTYIGHPLLDSHRFDVETVDNVISELRRSKARGLDKLSSEHLLCSHPTLTIVLTRLFNIMLLNGVIPDNFFVRVILLILLAFILFIVLAILGVYRYALSY